MTGTSNTLAAHRVTSGPKNHFFGFHDVCPWDVSDKRLLAMETDFIDRPPAPRDKARICLIDAKSGELKVIAETRAWNFHQGCRLQWLPGATDKIIYNDREGNDFISVIMDVKTGKKVTFPYPVYAVSPVGDYGLGVNFSRLQRYGGYGYPAATEGNNDPFPKNDGVFKVDFETGKIELLISIHSVAHFKNAPRDDEHHILTHIAFNLSGTRICFVDKFKLPDGGFWNRFISANPDGSDMYVLPGHISHFDWRNDDEIFGYGKFNPKIMTLRKTGIFQSPLLKPLLSVVRKMRGGLKQKIAGQGYLLFTDKTQKVKHIAADIMTEDGHPAFSPDGQWVVTDTYPDKHHYRTLILYDWEHNKKRELGKFYTLYPGANESWDVSEMRSDLHPRWNHKGTEICFDSVHEGTRQMYIVNI